MPTPETVREMIFQTLERDARGATSPLPENHSR
jgi:hypothetical protein